MILLLTITTLLVFIFIQKNEKNQELREEKKNKQMEIYPHYKVRPCDTWGCGYFGAPRKRNGRRYEHKGVDFQVPEHEPITCPIKGRIKRIGIAYFNTDYRLIVIEGVEKYQGFYLKILYIDPYVSVGQLVEEGDLLGFIQSLQTMYPGITDHIHVELWYHSEYQSKGGILLDPSKKYILK